MAVEKLNASANDAAETVSKPTKTRSRKPSAAEPKPVVLPPSSSLYGIAPYQMSTGEDYMSDAQFEHFSKILHAWKADLMQEVDRTMSYMQDESAALPDVNDRATQEEEFAIELRTRDRERKLIRKIEQSLQAIEEADYGFCETCGVEIGLRRLEARPTATQCIDCKTLAEIKEKQNHG